MILTRDVTQHECPWLPTDLPEGKQVFRYYGHDYGVVTPNGVAITLEAQDVLPFYEVPRNAVGWTDAPEAA